MFYRYELVKDHKSGIESRYGICTGLAEVMFDTPDAYYYAIFMYKHLLYAPNRFGDVNMTNTRSYFTTKGNKRCRKLTKHIKDHLVNGWRVEQIVRDNLDGEEIVYKDRNQIVIKYIDESSTTIESILRDKFSEEEASRVRELIKREYPDINLNDPF